MGFFNRNLRNDDDNRKLVAEHFPWFLETYDRLPKSIHKADATRYCYMYKFGGFYADFDVEVI
ncbi:hypothetical protein HK096_009888 [Nowakowskiella sp. JEL0078]|nr:hypothetical protein HK096_009888 [Nowakowskiella sp. JEL0078]